MKNILSRHEPHRWRQLYSAAILEPDHSKLTRLVHEAQHAIMNEIEEGLEAGWCAEQWELVEALNYLRHVRITSERNTAQRKAAKSPSQGQSAA